MTLSTSADTAHPPTSNQQQTHDMRYFIYLNGYPGIGKLTIANELARLIPNTKVYHNHLMIDPVAALVDRDDPEYHRIRSSFRRHILHVISTSESTRKLNWIFTDARCTSDIGSEAAQDFKLAAEQGGATFIPVALSCDLEENVRRTVTRAGVNPKTTKLTNPDLVCQVRQEEVMYQFGGREELQLDITHLSASEAAQKVSQHLKSLSQ